MVMTATIKAIRALEIPTAKKLPEAVKTITPDTIVAEADFFQYPNHREITANAADMRE